MIPISRMARKYLDTSFFHVMVQGINKEYIFNKNRYINRYLQLMQNNLNHEKLTIVAYCIMNNHAHLLMQVQNKEELSRYMQKVNSMYAKYYNYMENERVGYVFRDRYKSEPILDKRQLIQCVKYIHQNPVKANMVSNANDYRYSSYHSYATQQTEKVKVFTKEEIAFICNLNLICEEEFLDTEINIDKRIDNGISAFIKKEEIKVFEIFEKDVILKELIKYLKKYKNIKYTDIMKRFDITKGVMDRLKK